MIATIELSPVRGGTGAGEMTVTHVLETEFDLLKVFEYAPRAERCLAGSVIVREGEPGTVMYVVLEGSVEIRLAGVTIRTLGPGEFFGEMTLIDSHPRSAEAVAASDCRLALLDRQQFLHLVQLFPAFALHVMRVMAHRLRTLDRSVQALFELGNRNGI